MAMVRNVSLLLRVVVVIFVDVSLRVEQGKTGD